MEKCAGLVRWRTTSVIGAWTECSSSPASRSQPLSDANRRVVVIVEVASRGEDLDGLESVRGNFEQVRLLQPLFVIEVSGNTKRFMMDYPSADTGSDPYQHGREHLAQAARSADSVRGSCARS